MVHAGLLCHFSLFCLPFGSHSKHHNCCKLHLKFESITAQLWKQSSYKTSGHFSNSCFCMKKKSVSKSYFQTLLANSVFEDCVYIKNLLHTSLWIWKFHHLKSQSFATETDRVETMRDASVATKCCAWVWGKIEIPETAISEVWKEK